MTNEDFYIENDVGFKQVYDEYVYSRYSNFDDWLVADRFNNHFIGERLRAAIDCGGNNEIGW